MAGYAKDRAHDLDSTVTGTETGVEPQEFGSNVGNAAQVVADGRGGDTPVLDAAAGGNLSANEGGTGGDDAGGGGADGLATTVTKGPSRRGQRYYADIGAGKQQGVEVGMFVAIPYTWNNKPGQLVFKVVRLWPSGIRAEMVSTETVGEGWGGKWNLGPVTLTKSAPASIRPEQAGGDEEEVEEEEELDLIYTVIVTKAGKKWKVFVEVSVRDDDPVGAAEVTVLPLKRGRDTKAELRSKIGKAMKKNSGGALDSNLNGLLDKIVGEALNEIETKTQDEESKKSP